MRTRLDRLAVALLVAALGAGRALADDSCAADLARACPGIPAANGQLWACVQRNMSQLSSRCQESIREVQRRASDFNADCAPDVWRLCASVPAGEGRILDCLGAYLGRRELSLNCEEAVATALEKVQEFADACTGDVAALCKGVEPGKGRILMCLRSQPDRLSSRCRRAVNP